jgi:hypothetical protein
MPLQAPIERRRIGANQCRKAECIAALHTRQANRPATHAGAVNGSSGPSRYAASAVRFS